MEFTKLTIYTAESFLLRLRGLIARPALGDREALLISRCNSVHSIGMQYDLDVVFLDRVGKVVSISALKPYRWAFCRQAKMVLEFKSGYAEVNGCYVGAIPMCAKHSENEAIIYSIRKRK